MKSIIVSAIAAAVLVGSAAAGSAEEVTINFLNSERPDTYAPVIAEFERLNPGIKVRDQSVPFNQLNAQVQARVGGGDTSVDVYGVDEPRVPALATRKLSAGHGGGEGSGRRGGDPAGRDRDQLRRKAVRAAGMDVDAGALLQQGPAREGRDRRAVQRSREADDVGGFASRGEEGPGGRRQMGFRV